MEYQGNVKFYDPNKAYGFISGAPEGDVFIHRSNLSPGRDELIEGQEVLFKTRKSPRGAEAYDVVVVKESHLPPRPRVPKEFGSSPRPHSNGRPPRSHERSSERSFPTRVPSGPLAGEVTSIDQERRFMFVRTERDQLEVFVHSSLFSMTSLRRGDAVSVTVEQGPKGVRATSLEPA